ncbi:hypothetical protein [Sulfurovum sp.]|jgi:uncharacterized membrane protein YeaQ/YmgE (transglycosylase-associated protein family)|uniref:hypothetical protein n=1 Tax=Sulfurovum sp. TaxID=1969726 RepID=UPI002A364915|nr:hypothetical protein [Sulfurovum sp.]MDY0402909.1 hypothetical protein [Sulfurovum sp.]
MRLREKPLGFIINFFLGIAWASVLIGAVTPFFSFFHTGIFEAFFFAVIGALPGLVAILLLEHIITVKEKHDELRKQTRLLEQLLEKMDQQIPKEQ